MSGAQITPAIPQKSSQSAQAAFQAANETPAAKRLRDRLGSSMPNQGYNMNLTPAGEKANLERSRRLAQRYSAGI